MGRSGSTILANLLGEMNGFFSVGELHNLWGRSIIAGDECGCGQPVIQCDFWSRVLNDVLEGHDERAVTVSRWQRQELRLRHTHRLLRLRRLNGAPTPLRDYGDVLSHVYQRIGRVSGARVIVDSSKWPTAAALLRLLPEVEPYLIHLARSTSGLILPAQGQEVGGSRDATERSGLHRLELGTAKRTCRSGSFGLSSPSQHGAQIRGSGCRPAADIEGRRQDGARGSR